jgi:hypothetical protein
LAVWWWDTNAFTCFASCIRKKDDTPLTARDVFLWLTTFQGWVAAAFIAVLMGHFVGRVLIPFLGHAKDDPLGAIEMVVLPGILGFIVHQTYATTVNKAVEVKWFDQPILAIGGLILFGYFSLRAVVDDRRNSR